MSRPGKNVLDAIEGRLKPGKIPVCLSCAIARGWNAINLKQTPILCKCCGEETTWRKTM